MSGILINGSNFAGRVRDGGLWKRIAVRPLLCSGRVSRFVVGAEMGRFCVGDMETGKCYGYVH
jgi:hypothetical protein